MVDVQDDVKATIEAAGTGTLDAPPMEAAEAEGLRDVYPAFGFDAPTQLEGGDEESVVADEALVESTEQLLTLPAADLLEAGRTITIDAAALGHNPANRGRKTGPRNKYWRDYCTTTGGHICYGPYHTLGAGVYEYYYDLEFRIPACGGANATTVFEMDSTHNVGHRIPGSSVYAFRWNFMCSKADQHNVFRGFWGGRFAIADTHRKVEMRIKNRVTRIAGSQIELLVKRLRYRKIPT